MELIIDDEDPVQHNLMNSYDYLAMSTNVENKFIAKITAHLPSSKPPSNNIWVCDSGATCHMYNDKNTSYHTHIGVIFKPSIILTKNEEIKSGSVPFTPKVKPIKSSIDEFGYSQAGIDFALIRKHRDMEYLLGSFYLPSALFAVISLASFCIKPDTVPGRMGMIITLFLILINNYTSVAAPNGRGFSYIEVWYIGIQVPIVFAFLEYGIILYVMRKRSLGTVLHFGKCALTLDTLIFRVDQVSFVISSIYIAVFIAVYRQKALEIWVENEQRITHR